MTTSIIAAGGRVRFLAGPIRRALAVAGVAAGLATGCAGPAPDVPAGPDGEPDPVLVQGRDVYGSQCANCHGNEGQGGRGKPLNGGRALDRFPEIESMIEVVTEGKGSGMPSFGGKLADDEIEAVVRYVRDVLN